MNNLIVLIVNKLLKIYGLNALNAIKLCEDCEIKIRHNHNLIKIKKNNIIW